MICACNTRNSTDVTGATLNVVVDDDDDDAVDVVIAFDAATLSTVVGSLRIESTARAPLIVGVETSLMRVINVVA